MYPVDLVGALPAFATQGGPDPQIPVLVQIPTAVHDPQSGGPAPSEKLP